MLIAHTQILVVLDFYIKTPCYAYHFRKFYSDNWIIQDHEIFFTQVILRDSSVRWFILRDSSVRWFFDQSSLYTSDK